MGRTWIVDEARQDWIPQVEDSITWTRETSVAVRLAELDYQIRNDLEGMLGQEGPRTVNLLRGSQENGVKSLVNDHSANWWLIDSGASVTVIAKGSLIHFRWCQGGRCLQVRDVQPRMIRP